LVRKCFTFVLAVLLATSVLAGDPPKNAKPKEPQNIVDRTLAWLGIDYRFGGSDEKKGFDCAGLVKRVFGDSGVKLPRTAADQFRQGCAVSFDDLRPGDLVFFKDTYKRGISHVGIYIGEKLFVHAASRRRSVVVDRIDMPYYLKRFAGGRRVVEEEKKEAAAPPATPQTVNAAAVIPATRPN
jgi:cell wall-associated NlpC family hydrolase